MRLNEFIIPPLMDNLEDKKTLLVLQASRVLGIRPTFSRCCGYELGSQYRGIETESVCCESTLKDLSVYCHRFLEVLSERLPRFIIILSRMMGKFIREKYSAMLYIRLTEWLSASELYSVGKRSAVEIQYSETAPVEREIYVYTVF